MDKTLVILKALADHDRLRIMSALLQVEELCACQLTELLEIPSDTAADHLMKMEHAGLVVSRRSHSWNFYRIPSDLAIIFPLQWLKSRLGRDSSLSRDRMVLARLIKQNRNGLYKKQQGGCLTQLLDESI